MYSEKVMDHFTNPRNVGEIENASGVGTVGNAKCGDIMRIYLDIDDPANDFFKKELGFKKEPNFFLLSKDGMILEQWIGYVSVGDFIEAFEIALP